MWTRLLVANQQRLISPSVFVKRLQSSTQYYPINDDMYGFTDDQKEVRRGHDDEQRSVSAFDLAKTNGLRLCSERISPSC
jgi:hypothetical protein